MLNKEIDFGVHSNRKEKRAVVLMECTEKANVFTEAGQLASPWMAECKGTSNSDIILKASVWH